MGLLDKFFKKTDKINSEDNSETLKIGDWVNSYSKGIYRIDRIIEEYYDESEPEFSETKLGKKKEFRTIISKRFLNSKFKKSISYESCSEFYIKVLDDFQNRELEKFIKENPKSIEELNNYEIPEILCIYNSELQIDAENDLNKVNDLIEFIKSGKTFIEIQNKMQELDIMRLKPKYFGNYKLQFINFNDEYLDKRRLWRDAKLTKK